MQVNKDRVFIKKLPPLDLDYLNAIAGTLSEWTSPEDEEAYRDLVSSQRTNRPMRSHNIVLISI